MSKHLSASAGLRCPDCGGRRLRVTHTQPVPGYRVRRYRVCRDCGRRLATSERVQPRTK
jgi:transcriptional regulator NrdR family protein